MDFSSFSDTTLPQFIALATVHGGTCRSLVQVQTVVSSRQKERFSVFHLWKIALICQRVCHHGSVRMDVSCVSGMKLSSEAVLLPLCSSADVVSEAPDLQGGASVSPAGGGITPPASSSPPLARWGDLQGSSAEARRGQRASSRTTSPGWGGPCCPWVTSCWCPWRCVRMKNTKR